MRALSWRRGWLSGAISSGRSRPLCKALSGQALHSDPDAMLIAGQAWGETTSKQETTRFRSGAPFFSGAPAPPGDGHRNGRSCACCARLARRRTVFCASHGQHPQGSAPPSPGALEVPVAPAPRRYAATRSGATHRPARPHRQPLQLLAVWQPAPIGRGIHAAGAQDQPARSRRYPASSEVCACEALALDTT